MDAKTDYSDIKFFGTLLLFISLLFSGVSWASEVATPSPVATSYSPAGQIIKMVVGLIVVLVMIFALAWLAKNYMGFNPSSNPALKPLAGLLVGQKERIVLVKVGDRQILIGVAPGQINLLHLIEKGDEVVVTDDHTLSPFAEKLRKSIRRFDKS